MDDEIGECTVCHGPLPWYPQPGVEGKLEAFCQNCHDLRHKDVGRPESLDKEKFKKFREEEKLNK